MVFFLDVFHFLMYIFLHGGAELAQSVEQGTENPRVRGSIPRLGTIFVSVSRAPVPLPRTCQNISFGS